jgi:hypothetical protein
MKNLYSILVVSVIMSASCKKDADVTNDIGWNYFPTSIGHWVIYEVDSTVYDDFQGDTDVYRYQIKEILESSFTDNQGRDAIRVERWKRMYNPNLAYDSIPWYLSRVWSFTRTNSAAEKLQENERFIRLSFPVTQGNTWDGNAFNTQGSWTYKYKEVDKQHTVGNFNLDSTCLVEQKNEINLINHRSYKERYAKNIGLVEKNVIDVSDTGFGPVPVLNRIHSGVIYNITLVDYGPR